MDVYELLPLARTTERMWEWPWKRFWEKKVAVIEQSHEEKGVGEASHAIESARRDSG